LIGLLVQSDRAGWWPSPRKGRRPLCFQAPGRRVPEHRECRGVDPRGRRAQVGCGRRI